MKRRDVLLAGVAALEAAVGSGGSAWAATAVQIGSSGKTFASSTVQCASDPATGVFKPMVQAGLFNPRRNASGLVSHDGSPVKGVTGADPIADVWLADGDNSVVVTLGRRTTDAFMFAVSPGACDVPDTSGNTFSADGTLEYAASGMSYATVTPGCAVNPATGQPQPYVNLFDNGGFLLNISVNGVPLTQLSAKRPHAPVFLSIGQNVISAANGSLSTDYFVRVGGSLCVLAP